MSGDSVVAEKIGCTHEALRRWVRHAERDQGRRPGLTTDERQQLKALQRETAELKRANDILLKASALFCPGGARPPIEVMVACVDAQRETHGIALICRQLRIAPSTCWRRKAHQADPTRRSTRAAQRGPEGRD